MCVGPTARAFFSWAHLPGHSSLQPTHSIHSIQPQTSRRCFRKMVALLRPLSSAAAAAATLHLVPAAPLTGSFVSASAISGRKWRSVRTNAGGGGWLSGLLGGRDGGAPTAMTVTPGTVKAGDPVLHETAQEVAPGDVSSEKVQGIIDRMIDIMRKVPGVGLAAPQIGVPLRVCLCSCLRSLHS